MQYAIFDLDNTILDFDRAEAANLAAVFQHHGVTDIRRAENEYQAYNETVWQQIEQGADRDSLLDQRFQVFLGTLGITVDGPAVQQEYDQLLAHSYQVIPGAHELLRTLTNAGLTLLVGTNGINIKHTQLSRLAGAHMTPYFDHIFISESIGYAKPNPHFFNAIHDQYPDMNATNTVMIGDSLRSDIAGAATVQLPSIWYNPQHAHNDTTIAPTYTVDNFKQLQKLLLTA
ncbi:YjjG family noncanonical pyrimidine nucleotidase [Lactiplantibacillus plantarum]|uniref:YjjG family noncanonical pyrimidine nucleotidase n=1 Tax=Lactiplantibacillus plantarum TaxID=1590 RepID=UPI0009310534|nr:YjjG family noncanonical pyrimidine nucleotidase [Lactiplantibacillus plantarum]MCL3856150.1 YjjG family noncanonical pyrimidine nucleotidase [Lactiplantibacillus plantarum]